METTGKQALTETSLVTKHKKRPPQSLGLRAPAIYNDKFTNRYDILNVQLHYRLCLHWSP